MSSTTYTPPQNADTESNPYSGRLHSNSNNGPTHNSRKNMLIIIASAVVVGFLFFCLVVYATIHHVPEGFVAVYYRGGALLKETANPGYNFKLPITSYKLIQVTLQTDVIKDVPCGTQGGVIITFDRIEVVNILSADSVHDVVKKYTADYDKALIHNKVHHEINQFCSKHTIQEVYIDLFDTIDENLKQSLMKDLLIMAPGLIVDAVRVTKPVIPKSILQNYEKMEAEKTELLVAHERQKVVEKVAETAQKKAVIEAEQVKKVAAIQHQQRIAEKEMEKTINKLANDILLDKEKAAADADAYKKMKDAEANAMLLTPEFLELQRIQAVKENNKIYYGDSIPKAFIDSELMKKAMAKSS